VTGGDLAERARSFGLRAERVDGSDVEAVWSAAERAVARARSGRGPSFLLARCSHPEGHFLGDALLRQLDVSPWEARRQLEPTLRALRRSPGAPLPARALGLVGLLSPLVAVALRRAVGGRDPLARAARRLPASLAASLDARATDEVRRAVEAALAEAEVPRRG
jgi:pyruvate dehydrogenase E1 component alpha subunit